MTQPSKRLGKHGCQELKDHKFFDGFDWDGIARKELKSPLLEHLCENKPENLYQELKIDEAISLNGLADDRIWNQEYSLRPNSNFLSVQASNKYISSMNQESNYSEVIQQACSANAITSV